ncbi:nucleotidyl transferase AbiEii/AbiGii toxin family protein [Propioniciclava flava]
MEKNQALVDLIAMSAPQWGLVTTAQARILGLEAYDLVHLAERGLIRRVRHGVYATPITPADQLEDIRAQWLATDPTRTAAQRRTDPVHEVVVSHDSAAVVYRIGDMPTPEVHLTANRRIRPRANVKAYQTQLHPREVQLVNGLPTTSIRRTLEDISRHWEPGHFRDAALDALDHKLLTRTAYGKSKILKAAAPDLAEPISHTGLKTQLAQAHDQGRTYDEFFRMQFLGVLGKHPDWVLKGGTNLIFRLDQARTTHDLDLFRDREGAAAESAALLTDLMNGTQVGIYTFHVSTQPQRQAHNEGVADVYRVEVNVIETSSTQPVNRFSIDVSGDVPLIATPQRHTMVMPTTLAGYPNQVSIALYPIENQLADKVMAMYQDYGTHQASTRYHDLYDAAQIINQLPIDAAVLDRALIIQQQRRHFTLPEGLPEPAPGWGHTYNQVAATKMPGALPPLTNYETAITTVRGQIIPALDRITANDARNTIRQLATHINTETPTTQTPNIDRHRNDPTR